MSYNVDRVANQSVTEDHLKKLAKHWQRNHGLTADGLIGPKTVAALEGRLESEGFVGTLETIPRNRAEVYKTFGNPGTGKADKKWVKSNIITVRDLPGVPHKWYVQLHRLAEPYVREALRRAKEASNYEIERFAGFVFRHQRHDSSRPLSYHSWGIAVDVNPNQNQAKTYSKLVLSPKPWTPGWREIWPNGVDEAFVTAFESVGFSWGGRWQSFRDPMHFELVQ